MPPWSLAFERAARRRPQTVSPACSGEHVLERGAVRWLAPCGQYELERYVEQRMLTGALGLPGAAS
jgi:hypothetical protein